MEPNKRAYPSQSYAPSAPSLPDSYGQSQSYTASSPASYYDHQRQGPSYGQPQVPSYGQPQVPSYGQPQRPRVPSYGQPPSPEQVASYVQFSSQGPYSFPPGTNPDVIRSFEMVDRDRSGFIDEKELQQALSSGYERFSLRTIRLLMFLFKNPHQRDSALRIGPKEFAELWSCLGQWRSIFERYDRDRSGKIDLLELRDALYSIGYAVPPSVLQILMSMYDNGSGRNNELNFDSFVLCGMIVKGLTEKFKEKDVRYTGSATFTYDAFMSMVIPFIVSYD